MSNTLPEEPPFKNQNLLEDRRYYTYIYLDPRKPGKYGSGNDQHDHEPLYVGFGRVPNRYLFHLEFVKTIIDSKLTNKEIFALKENFHKICKIKKIINSGQEPIIIKVLENATKQEAIDEEIRLIAFYGRADKGLGPLTNLTNGGEGGPGAGPGKLNHWYGKESHNKGLKKI